MIQKKEPAIRVKKNANAKSHEKLNWCRYQKAPTTQSPKLINPTMARRNEKPANRLASRYSPSGTGTTSERSLISLGPPVSAQLWSPRACPNPRDALTARRLRWHSGFAAAREVKR